MGMKCVKCGTDNDCKKTSDNGRRCKNCNHPFAFDPYENGDLTFTSKCTDEFFAKAIEDISAANTRFFTDKQLFYILERRLLQVRLMLFWCIMGQVLLVSLTMWMTFYFILFANFLLKMLPGNLIILFTERPGEEGREITFTAVGSQLFLMLSISLFLGAHFLAMWISKSIPANPEKRRYIAKFSCIFGLIILVIGISWSAHDDSFLLFMFSITTGLLSIYLGFQELARITNSRPQFLISKEQFQTWLNRWQEIHNPIGKMLPPAPEESLPAEVSTELTSYSFERAVICDSSAIAQLLIANNFHLENNCAVLSVTGYPQSIFSTVLEMLSQNPDLKVYALHDASPRGVTLAHHLRTSPNWFQNCNVIIHDLGLLPRQIFASRNVFIRISEDSAREAKEMQVEVRQSFSASELEWLEAGNFVELESFSPQKIMQILNQGIAQSQYTIAGYSWEMIDGD
jgi:hypothetical protein